MAAQGKAAALDLAVAFLRKRAAGKFQEICRREVEEESRWIFDYYHPRWHQFRREGLPYGYRVCVEKGSGRASHFATLQKKPIQPAETTRGK